MSTFVISYVPEVENVQNIENIEVVQDVRQLPFPYFPLKKFNFQKGGMVHITPTQNLHQAVFIPDKDIEFKGVHLSFTSYNIEDTYDVMIGSRYLIKDSHVKEMTEYRMLEVYEDVGAGTPIVVNFHNNSGHEKYLMYEMIALIDEEVMLSASELEWDFYWEDQNVEIGSEDYLTVVVNQPNYVNMSSYIDTFYLDIIDRTLPDVNIATIYCDSQGNITSTYEETEEEFLGEGFLARVNVTALKWVERNTGNITITFKNISSIDPHPIEIGVRGFVLNRTEAI